MSIVTVIIPAFNAEKYLYRCLDSVVNQNFSDFEVILVDDGSCDGTAGIIRSYQSRYPFIHYYYKENGGLSSARNYGMKQTGESKYVAFLDSDDYLDADYLMSLINKAEQRQSDVVCSGQYRVTESGQIISHVQYHLDKQGKCILRHLNMHGKLYRTDYLKKHHLVFPEGKTYEDNPFNLAAFFLTSRIDFLQYEGYYQLIHPDSITTRKVRQSDVPYKELEQAIQYVIANKANDYDVFEYTIMSFFTYFILEANRKHRYFKLADRKSDTQVLEELCDFAERILKQYCPSYMHNPYLSVCRKNDIGIKQKLAVAVFMRMMHWNCAKAFVKIFYKV